MISLYGDHFQNSTVRLTTMRCPFLALYIIGSCPTLKSTAFSLPGWISILMLRIITDTFWHFEAHFESTCWHLTCPEPLWLRFVCSRLHKVWLKVRTNGHTAARDLPETNIYIQEYLVIYKHFKVLSPHSSIICNICPHTFCLGSSHVMWKTMMLSVKLLTEIPAVKQTHTHTSM